MSIFDQIAGSGASSGDVMTALQLMQRGGIPRPKVQMLRQAKPVPDVASPDDFAATPLFAQTDEEMVRNQLALTGGVGAQILEEHSGPDVPRPQMIDGRMDYTGMQPVRGMDDLLNNRTFRTLASQDPHKASTIYKELTGKDFSKDYSEMEKQRLAKESDFTNGIRDQIMKGEMRRHPTQGWLERAVTEPGDPMRGIPANKTWEPVDSTVLQADIDYGRKALGYSRPETVVDKIPMVHRNLFMQEYYAQQKAGKDDKTALNLAVEKLHSSYPQLYKQPGTRNDASPTVTPTVAAANPDPAPADTESPEYQAWAMRQALQTKGKVGNFFTKSLPDAMAGSFDLTAGNAIRTGAVVGKNVARGAMNAVNQLGVLMGRKEPLVPWMAPVPFSEIDDPYAPNLEPWMRRRP